ncbi:MAG: hypothetical protein Ctma_0652 [Catillopecten margaritatus gill symbiont]|uniref:Uncharacterized protein n=1 Tax=Catillopecten margaritatus gill symbiont TaxID=3083288 RepID=A0AAU6PG21_9GAMM
MLSEIVGVLYYPLFYLKYNNICKKDTNYLRGSSTVFGKIFDN